MLELVLDRLAVKPTPEQPKEPVRAQHLKESAILGVARREIEHELGGDPQSGQAGVVDRIAMDRYGAAIVTWASIALRVAERRAPRGSRQHTTLSARASIPRWRTGLTVRRSLSGNDQLMNPQGVEITVAFHGRDR